nr:PREDICTED: protein root UVB sensitive 2, chloroplastic-like isoform X4 [Nicotiana tabacum]XP_016495074.1 PREDICTED: protein root UVB sensitive 2, chloroplastic-like isoform X4 [Nicotiana tabacum]
MQHVGKLICSNLGARMDSEPKRWRILGLHDVHGALCYAVILLISLKELLLQELILLLAFLCHIIKILIILAFYTAADVLYDLGTGLEVMSPLCPHLFLEVAGLGNFAKGMAVVAARATRLPIYSSFAKEGNLSDLFAKGEAISTLFNVLGLGAGIHLASTICSSMQGKLVVAPLLSIIHVYSVCEEMRATPVNTLNPQRTAMIVAEFVKTGKISSPADLRYQEDLVFPGRLIEDAGNVKVGRSLHEVVSPSKLRQFKETFHEEKFLLNRGSRWTDMILEHDATGEDALRGWMVAAYASDMERLAREPSTNISQEAYEKMNSVFSPFLAELQAKGWHTDRFLDGTGSRFVF